MKIIVVHGAPCSGKSTYVQERLGDKDIVYDYDLLLEALTNKKERARRKHAMHKIVIGQRASLIQALKDKTAEPENAYFITTQITEKLKKELEGLKVVYHAMPASLEECLERLEADERRPDKEAWRELIISFYEEKKEGKEMSKTTKLKSVSTISANPEADIELINQYTVKELTPQEVFCFSLALCDNEADRDNEYFTTESLGKLAPLFLGKSVMFDHRWSAEGQVARLYRTFVEKQNEKTSLGEQKQVLRASAYMLREGNMELIKAIEGGIKKEISIGCQVEACNCSICGERLKYQWETGKTLCKNGHIKGDEYDGKKCLGKLEDPEDAYEVSFVAVPAQKEAGVTKSAEDVSEAAELLKNANLETLDTELKKKLIAKLQMSLSEDSEKEKRAKILAENKKHTEEF